MNAQKLVRIVYADASLELARLIGHHAKTNERCQPVSYAQLWKWKQAIDIALEQLSPAEDQSPRTGSSVASEVFHGDPALGFSRPPPPPPVRSGNPRQRSLSAPRTTPR